MTRLGRGGAVVGFGLLVLGAAVALGFEFGNGASPAESREFMFQVLGVSTPNQGGHTVNVFIRYRYTTGIAESELPNYVRLRTVAINALTTDDFSHKPFWETINQRMCRKLKNGFPIQAISCELQVVAVETPGPRYEPGYHASVETIGKISPLAIPGPTG
jgi:hypothetical protein